MIPQRLAMDPARAGLVAQQEGRTDLGGPPADWTPSPRLDPVVARQRLNQLTVAVELSLFVPQPCIASDERGGAGAACHRRPNDGGGEITQAEAHGSARDGPKLFRQ